MRSTGGHILKRHDIRDAFHVIDVFFRRLCDIILGLQNTSMERKTDKKYVYVVSPSGNHGAVTVEMGQTVVGTLEKAIGKTIERIPIKDADQCRFVCFVGNSTDTDPINELASDVLEFLRYDIERPIDYIVKGKVALMGFDDNLLDRAAISALHYICNWYADVTHNDGNEPYDIDDDTLKQLFCGEELKKRLRADVDYHPMDEREVTKITEEEDEDEDGGEAPQKKRQHK